MVALDQCNKKIKIEFDNRNWRGNKPVVVAKAKAKVTNCRFIFIIFTDEGYSLFENRKKIYVIRHIYLNIIG